MEAHLKKATEKYEAEAKIHPISQLDAETISVLIDIIEQRGWTDLSSILKQYKKMDDQDILDMLAEYSISIDEDLAEEQPEQHSKGEKPKEFVEIGGRIFRTFGLFTFRRTTRWDEDRGGLHCILVNEGPLPGSAQWYMDTFLDFESAELRDREWEGLQSKMKKQNCKFL